MTNNQVSVEVRDLEGKCYNGQKTESVLEKNSIYVKKSTRLT